MAMIFNAIACAIPLQQDMLMVAGVVMGRLIGNAIRCPHCGSEFSLIVPVTSAEPEVLQTKEELAAVIESTCGRHPPIIQSG